MKAASVIGTVLPLTHGSIEIVAFEGPYDAIRRVERYTPDDGGRAVIESCRAQDTTDASPRHSGRYDATCSYCWLHITHTERVHDAARKTPAMAIQRGDLVFFNYGASGSDFGTVLGVERTAHGPVCWVRKSDFSTEGVARFDGQVTGRVVSDYYGEEFFSVKGRSGIGAYRVIP